MERGDKVQHVLWCSYSCSDGCNCNIKTPFLKTFIVLEGPNNLNQDPHGDIVKWHCGDWQNIQRIWHQHWYFYLYYSSLRLELPNKSCLLKGNQWNVEIEEKCYAITKEVEIYQISCLIKT